MFIIRIYESSLTVIFVDPLGYSLFLRSCQYYFTACIIKWRQALLLPFVIAVTINFFS